MEQGMILFVAIYPSVGEVVYHHVGPHAMVYIGQLVQLVTGSVVVIPCRRVNAAQLAVQFYTLRHEDVWIETDDGLLTHVSVPIDLSWQERPCAAPIDMRNGPKRQPGGIRLLC
ncbi:hypothetical protein AOT83_04440 [Mycobacteroides sp. H001]|nr:hypothetical protein AOT83_04440 [Mycobacteroides sp. H001]